MAIRLESFDPGGYANRRLHLLDLEQGPDLEEGPLDFAQKFSVLIAWDAAAQTPETVESLLAFLLSEGAVSVSCWGPECEKVHELLVGLINGSGEETSRFDPKILTTWHARESFGQTLWYALHCAIPDETFEESCRDSLVVVVGDPARGMEAREALADVDRFSEAIVAS